MKRFTLILGTAAAITAGCEKATDSLGESKSDNRAMVQYVQSEQADAAVIRQQALYDYHFEENGAVLNVLGRRDCAILAQHYRTYPGTLRVRRSGESDALYDARVKTILDALALGGVDTARVTVTDGAPGGAGMDSERVVYVKERLKRLDEQRDANFTGGEQETQN